jgi:hypothetical protein
VSTGPESNTTKATHAVMEALQQTESARLAAEDAQAVFAMLSLKDVRVEFEDAMLHRAPGQLKEEVSGVEAKIYITPTSLQEFQQINQGVHSHAFEQFLVKKLEAYGFRPPHVHKGGEITRSVASGVVQCTLGEHFVHHHQKCAACEPGSYCVYEFKFLCPKGKYQPKAHETECFHCPEKSYTALDGSNMCLSCPKELSFSPARRDVCCTSASQNDCRVPAGGTMAPTPSSTRAPTPPPTPEPLATCTAGNYVVQGGGCAACGAGQFQDAQQTTEIASLCKHCPAGKYQPGTAAQMCSQCPEGKYQMGSAGRSCTACSGLKPYATDVGDECTSIQTTRHAAADRGKDAAADAHAEARSLASQVTAASDAATVFAAAREYHSAPRVLGQIAADAAKAAGGSLAEIALAGAGAAAHAFISAHPGAEPPQVAAVASTMAMGVGGTPPLGVQAAAIGATAAATGKGAAMAGHEVAKAVLKAGGSKLQAQKAAGFAAGMAAVDERGSTMPVFDVPGVVSAAVLKAVTGQGGDKNVAMAEAGHATTAALMDKGIRNTTEIVRAAVEAADLVGNSSHVRAQVAGAAVALSLSERNSSAAEVARLAAAAVMQSGGSHRDAVAAAGLAAGATVVDAGGNATEAAAGAGAAAGAEGGSQNAVADAEAAAAAEAAMCEDGEYQTERRLADGTPGGADCSQCPPGFICREDIRVPCEAGEYADGATGNQCVRCHEGTFAPAKGSAQCQNCHPPAMYASVDRSFCAELPNMKVPAPPFVNDYLAPPKTTGSLFGAGWGPARCGVVWCGVVCAGSGGCGCGVVFRPALGHDSPFLLSLSLALPPLPLRAQSTTPSHCRTRPPATSCTPPTSRPSSRPWPRPWPTPKPSSSTARTGPMSRRVTSTSRRCRRRGRKAWRCLSL